MDNYVKLKKIDNFFNNLKTNQFDKILLDNGINEINPASDEGYELLNSNKTMRCIGKTCRYYQDHDFRESCFICSLVGTSRTKADIRDCLIKDIIQDMQDNLIEVEEYSKFIEENQ